MANEFQVDRLFGQVHSANSKEVAAKFARLIYDSLHSAQILAREYVDPAAPWFFGFMGAYKRLLILTSSIITSDTSVGSESKDIMATALLKAMLQIRDEVRVGQITAAVQDCISADKHSESKTCGCKAAAAAKFNERLNFSDENASQFATVSAEILFEVLAKQKNLPSSLNDLSAMEEYQTIGKLF